jgi:glycosyltransferase involved in cell wall biosynthesis
MLKFSNLSNTKIIPHGIFPIRNISFTQRLKRKRILFIGRIVKYKGVEVLINAVNNLEGDYELIIAGDANYNVEVNNINKNITLINKFLTEEEIAEKLSWCDIIALPYIEATQSGVISLGIFAEKPMICTIVGGLSEQVSEQEAIFVEPNNVKELTEAIRLLSTNTAKYDKICDNLKAKKESLKWEHISNEVLQFLYK